MDEGIVERGKNVGNTENNLALSDLGAELNGGFLLGGLSFLWGLLVSSKTKSQNPSKTKR